jgi:hypothetical protein
MADFCCVFLDVAHNSPCDHLQGELLHRLMGLQIQSKLDHVVLAIPQSPTAFSGGGGREVWCMTNDSSISSNYSITVLENQVYVSDKDGRQCVAKWLSDVVTKKIHAFLQGV